MPTCKQCGARFSPWADNPNGLCKPCLEVFQAEAVQKENEKQRQSLVAAREAIGSVASMLVGDGEEPLHVVFLHSGVEEKSSGLLKKLPGMIAGVALGGAMGEMVFGGSLLSNTATYAGELDVLVVTPTSIFLGCCSDVPFFSQNAEINLEHLQLIETQCKMGAIVQFAWTRSEVPMYFGETKIVHTRGYRRFALLKSELHVNGTIYQTSSLAAISKLLGKPAGKLLADGSRCVCCGKPVSGALIPLEVFIGNSSFSMRDGGGHFCTACGAVSCAACRKKAIGFNWWHGYEKARCASCAKFNPDLKVIVPAHKVELIESRLGSMEGENRNACRSEFSAEGSRRA